MKTGDIYPYIKTQAGWERIVGVHDCEYIAQQNAMIPAAEAYANQRVIRPEDQGGQKWSRVFSARMDELVHAPIVENPPDTDQ